MTQAAIREIVVSVTTCKFVQTDHHIDEIVQLQLLKTLQFMIQYIPHFMVLSCSWDVLQFFLKTLTLTGKCLFPFFQFFCSHSVFSLI